MLVHNKPPTMASANYWLGVAIIAAMDCRVAVDRMPSKGESSLSSRVEIDFETVEMYVSREFHLFSDKTFPMASYLHKDASYKLASFFIFFFLKKLRWDLVA